MPSFLIWSAPEEPYEAHIKHCLEAWTRLKNRMLFTLSRLFETKKEDVDRIIEMTILSHDIGKLSFRWQEYIHLPKDKRKKPPPHATLGAPYLFSVDDDAKTDLHFAGALAILMHHTDSGLAQGNLEHPAEDAVLRGLVEYGTEKIRWAEGAESAFQRSLEFIYQGEGTFHTLESITLSSLENLAKDLRMWARCPIEVERHKHRIQALAVHHILKVCDWRAASQRPKQEPDEDEDSERIDARRKQSLLSVYLDGGLIV